VCSSDLNKADLLLRVSLVGKMHKTQMTSQEKHPMVSS